MSENLFSEGVVPLMNYKNTTAVILVFACIFGFTACRKIEADGDFEKVSEVFVVGEDGEEHTLAATVNNDTGETEYFYEDNEGNVVTVKAKEGTFGKTEFYVTDSAGKEVTVKARVEESTVARTRRSEGTSAAYEDVSLTPEQESFLANFENQNPEDYLDQNAETATLAMGNEVHNLEKMSTSVYYVPGDASSSSGSDENLSKNQKFFNQLAKKNAYTLKFTMRSDTGDSVTTMPVTIAKSGNNMYMEMSMPVDAENSGKSQGSMTVKLYIKDGKCRAYLPNIKAYFELPDESYKEMMNEVALGMQSTDQTGYQGSVTAVLQGKSYDVDIYNENGNTVYYYYNGATPKRIESVSDDGASSILEYTQIVYSADASYFKEPVGYLNMTNMLSGDMSGVFPGIN